RHVPSDLAEETGAISAAEGDDPAPGADAGAAAARLLRRVEVEIGDRAEAGRVLRVHRISRGGDAACEHVSPGHFPDSGGDRQGVVRSGLGEEEDELVAAEAADQVGGAEALAEELAELAEERVAAGVAAALVGRLEVVEIDHQE